MKKKDTLASSRCRITSKNELIEGPSGLPIDSYTLVLANGAFKSGSTWLREIVLNLREFGPVPAKYACRSLKHWVCDTRITELLDNESIGKPILSKSHIFFPKVVREILKRPNVRILNIKRDVRDAVVSSYYYFMQRRKLKLSFSTYYKYFGRVKAAELRAYHKVWDIDDPKILTLQFEDLKTDFANTVQRLAEFLEVPIDAQDIDRIKGETSIENLRSKRGESSKEESKRFFRRGAIGDWEQHFSDTELKDLEKIEKDGIRGPLLALYWLLNPVRRSFMRILRRFRLN